MRQIDEFKEKNNILLILDPDNALCRSLLVYHRQFREVFGSKSILDSFRAEFEATKNIKIPAIDQPYKTDAERETLYKTLTTNAETEVRILNNPFFYLKFSLTPFCLHKPLPSRPQYKTTLTSTQK
jgi:hypothetical protein